MSAVPALERKLLRDFGRIWGQGVATAVIVACGVALMIMSLGALNSLQESQAAYYERQRFADVFAHVKRAPERVADRIAEIDGVNAVETRIVEYVTLDVPGLTDPATGQLVSLPSEFGRGLNAVLLHRGRPPEPRADDEVIANRAFVDAHGFQLGDEFRALINGRYRTLRIVGVGDSPEFIYTLSFGSLMPDHERFGVFWMNRAALAAAFDLEGAFSDLSLTLSPGAREENVIDAVDDLLEAYGGAGAHGRDEQMSHAFLDAEMQQLSAMAVIMPPIFLIVSAVFLNIILSRHIDTERRQIGLLKAFGYSDGEVFLHYVTLSLAIAALGVAGGLALGTALARLMTGLYAENFEFPILVYRSSPSAIVIGSAAAFSAAALGALNAAGRAARLAPAEAMAPAPPVSYRGRGLLALTNVRDLDTPTRLIFRHLARWPWRAFTTVAGVGAAGGLMISAMFAFDSIDLMIETYYHRAAPYDASLRFTEARSTDAIEDVLKLPGVIAAEPARDVTVRLSFEGRTERTRLVGVEPHGTMRRMLNEDLDEIVLPERGIVLSVALADQLGAGIGDVVGVETLDGRKREDDAAIVAFNGDFIGAAAYMDRRAVNRLMGEGDLATEAYVRLDRSMEDAFDAAVKARPAIAGVGLQYAALEMFHETVSENMTIMMTIYRLIGAAIAAGVVYNAVRIALSERAHELASLRVLGLTRAEASYVLLGEQILLVCAALPFGAVIGYWLMRIITAAMSTELYRIPKVVEPSTYGWAAVIVLAASLVTMFIVRRRIDRLDLVAVLKTRE